jgi:hypothetical protein
MEKIASGILDKHPGYTTLVCIMYLYGSGSGISKKCWIYICTRYPWIWIHVWNLRLRLPHFAKKQLKIVYWNYLALFKE